MASNADDSKICSINSGDNWFSIGIFSVYSFSEDDISAASEKRDRKLTGICNLCKPATTAISGRRNVTSNFRKHLHEHVCHPSALRELDQQKNRKRPCDDAGSESTQPKQLKLSFQKPHLRKTLIC